ncbi:putative phage tail protein [Amycolatopsis sp. NPDC101161]|uniref:putative phage tail protein n=1 Tax=Amycolatopsis sp. NPDC101161 TaxID=3363940 RepID=UPI0038184FDB
MPKNLIIHNLEVRFQVDGDDGALFTRLFNKHIQAWSRLYEDECARAERSDEDRRLGDPGGRR